MSYMPYRERPPEVQPKWRRILAEQGRTMTWLSTETGKSYPLISAYSIGRKVPPPEWLDKVSELLGVDVR